MCLKKKEEKSNSKLDLRMDRLKEEQNENQELLEIIYLFYDGF